LLNQNWGHRLLVIRDAFISKNCIKAYEGFATAQWARLEKVQGEWGAKERKLYMHMVRLMLSLESILYFGYPLVAVGAHAKLLRELLEAERHGTRYYVSLKNDLFNRVHNIHSTLPQKPQYQTAEDFLLWVRLAAAKRGFALHE
jgi:hypothetical protein